MPRSAASRTAAEATEILTPGTATAATQPNRPMADRAGMRLLLAIFVSVAVSGSAGAQGPANIALESYTGDRPADAPRLLSPILDELAARGFTAGDTLARKYDAQVSRPQAAPG